MYRPSKLASSRFDLRSVSPRQVLDPVWVTSRATGEILGHYFKLESLGIKNITTVWPPMIPVQPLNNCAVGVKLEALRRSVIQYSVLQHKLHFITLNWSEFFLKIILYNAHTKYSTVCIQIWLIKLAFIFLNAAIFWGPESNCKIFYDAIALDCGARKLSCQGDNCV